MFIMFYKQLHIPVYDTETSFSVRIELFDFGSKNETEDIEFKDKQRTRGKPLYTNLYTNLEERRNMPQ